MIVDTAVAGGDFPELDAATQAIIWLFLLGLVGMAVLAAWLLRRILLKMLQDPERLAAVDRVEDGLLTCPSCGQRTAPGAECQWCDEPLGGGG